MVTSLGKKWRPIGALVQAKVSTLKSMKKKKELEMSDGLAYLGHRVLPVSFFSP